MGSAREFLWWKPVQSLRIDLWKREFKLCLLWWCAVTDLLLRGSLIINLLAYFRHLATICIRWSEKEIERNREFHPTSILSPTDCKCREEKTRQPSTIIDNWKTDSGDEWATHYYKKAYESRVLWLNDRSSITIYRE